MGLTGAYSWFPKDFCPWVKFGFAAIKQNFIKMTKWHKAT